MKKKLNVINSILVLLIALVFLGVLYCTRFVFLFKYDPEYYENYYYHSQWIYPNSTRGISDGELYKFVGYQLVKGENPFNINYETPPLGKYLYGLAERYLENPYYMSIFVFALSIIFIFFLTNQILRNIRLSLLSALFFLSTPFVATQVGETMLDLPMMFFYMVHFLFFVKYLSQKNINYLIVSGVFLGLATGTKNGIYTPFIILLGLVFFILCKRKILGFILYFGSVFAGYALAFFCYFIRHPNPFPWLRLHEKVLRFYLMPANSFDFLSVWKSMFLNSYQGWWWTDQKTPGGASLVLPIGVIMILPAIILAVKKRNMQMLYLIGACLIFLFVNSFIPFFSRYLMTTIPLFVVLIVYLFQKKKLVILFFSILNVPFLFSILTVKNPLGDAQAVARFFSTRAYHELYRSISYAERNEISEEDFIRITDSFLEKFGTREIKVEILNVSEESNKLPHKAKVLCLISYDTKYGQISHESTVEFVKTYNQWRQNWQWDFLWPGYSPESDIVINEDTIPVKEIEKDNLPIAKRGKWKMVYIFPRVMFDWSKSLQELSEVIGDSQSEIDKRLRSVVPDHFVRFAGYIDPALGDKGIEKTNMISGTLLRDIDYLLNVGQNSKETSSIIKSIQKQKPELFCVKADIYLIKRDKEKIMMPFKCSQEKDVVIRL